LILFASFSFKKKKRDKINSKIAGAIFAPPTRGASYFSLLSRREKQSQLKAAGFHR
jgi:hypothetical protein